MKRCLLLVILLLAGCASPAPRPVTSGYDEEKAERQEYNSFFFGGWLPNKSAPNN